MTASQLSRDSAAGERHGLRTHRRAARAAGHRAPLRRAEIAPAAAKYDQSGEFPLEIIQKAWELGLASVSIPSEYNGVGLSLFDSCLVVEELAWGCAGMATSIMCNDLGLTPILVGGSDVQKKEWLGRLTKDFTLGLVLPLRARRGLRRRGAPAPRREETATSTC